MLTHEIEKLRQQRRITIEQKIALKSVFALDSYPRAASIIYLSHELNLKRSTIKNWFHSYRTRLGQLFSHNTHRHNFNPVKLNTISHTKFEEMPSGKQQLGQDTGTLGSELSFSFGKKNLGLAKSISRDRIFMRVA